MPTLTLPDGAVLAWGDTPAAAPIPEPVPIPEPAPAAVPVEAPPSTVTPADVSRALAKAPPRWVATAWRFFKTLVAAIVAALVAYQGDLAALIADPRAAIAVVGTAILTGADKFLRWQDDTTGEEQ